MRIRHTVALPRSLSMGEGELCRSWGNGPDVDHSIHRRQLADWSDRGLLVRCAGWRHRWDVRLQQRRPGAAAVSRSKYRRSRLALVVVRKRKEIGLLGYSGSQEPQPR